MGGLGAGVLPSQLLHGGPTPSSLLSSVKGAECFALERFGDAPEAELHPGEDGGTIPGELGVPAAA